METRAVPKCRIDTGKISLISAATDCRSVTSVKEIGQAMVSMRLASSLLAADIAKKIKTHTSTISRYENGRFSFEQADLDMLQRYAIACGKNKYSLFTDYLLFRKFHKLVLQAYIEEHNITKTDMAKTLGVSKTLVLSWFNKENRCPGFKLWEEKLKEFTGRWLTENIIE